MGLIKDIIDANSIEQKRRLANRLPIDMEDKNSLINNKNNAGEGGGSGSGEGSGGETNIKYTPKYYKINWDVAKEGWNDVLSAKHSTLDANIFVIASTYKSTTGVIVAYAPEVPNGFIDSFSFLPVYLPEEYGIGVSGIMDINKTIEAINQFTSTILEASLALTMDGITEITEEQFYNLEA